MPRRTDKQRPKFGSVKGSPERSENRGPETRSARGRVTPARAPEPKFKSEPAPEPEPEPVEPSYAESLAGLTRRERRVGEIVSMMSRGAWLSGVSDDLLAKKWNCDPSNVRHIASEANRVIRLRLRDDPKAREEARALILQNIETVRAKAMGNGDPQSLRVALDALRAYGFYLGIEPAKKLDVTGRQDPVEGWTVDEKLAYARDGLRPRRALRGVMAADGNGVDGSAEDGSVH